MDRIDEAKEQKAGRPGRKPGGPRAARAKSKGPGARGKGFGPKAGNGLTGKPLGKPLASPVGKPLARPVATPRTERVGEPQARPLGKPEGKPLGRPLGKPLGKPGTGPGPVGRPPDHFRPRPGVKPARPVRRPPPSDLPAPTLDPLAAAKLTWQPALRWCQKELKEAQLTDPKVLAGIREFQPLVEAVLKAPDAEQFRTAQIAAVGLVRKYQFLRWAPIPKRLPSP